MPTSNPLFTGLPTISGGSPPTSFRTATGNTSVDPTEAGYMIFVDSADATEVDFPAASEFSDTARPVWICRLGAGLVTLTSSSTINPDPAKIRNQYGTLVVYKVGADEYLAVHDGLAGSIWEMQ